MKNFSKKDIYDAKEISSEEVSRILGISIQDVQALEKEEILHPSRKKENSSFFFAQDIIHLKSNKGNSLSDEAEQVNIHLQQNIANSFSFIRKILFVVIGGVVGYFLLVGIIALFFVLFPVQTARWLWYVPKTQKSLSLQKKTIERSVLGAATSSLPNNRASPWQTMLQPVGKVSLGLVKYANPAAYEQVAKVAIIDTNDVLSIDSSNALAPVLPLKVSNTSLEITNAGLIANLNSQYLQGKVPGTNVGNLAVIGANGGIEGLPVPTSVPQQVILPLDNTPLVGLTNSNLSGPLIGGGTVPLGGTLTLDCPTCNSTVDLTTKVTNVLPLTNGGTGATSLTANSILYGNGTDAVQALTPGTSGYVLQSNGAGSAPSWVSIASNTISGITADSLTAGDFSSKINLGTYTIDISGNAATATNATNFSGSLLGDVSGTQRTTSVDKIKGAVLGTTTATSGNVLIGNGTQWVTQGLSGDAALTSGGVLTLKNTGLAGTYGSASRIPVLTTDAQGRVTGVIDTTIAGLTSSNFTSANISQWTNNSGYITASTTDTLTNKTIAAGSNTISGLTNGNLSGSAGITNGNLANSIISLAGNSGSGSVFLGGTLSISGAGIATVDAAGSTLTLTATEADTLSSVTGRGASTTTALTLSNSANTITAGTLTATGGTINGTTIGALSPGTGVFTTVNGLTFTNNGGNTLNITAGKTLSVSNSLTFTGTDGTTFAFPVISDDVVGRTVAQTLTNKTIAAGSNTISGLTNSNLSGSAGITNANLANSSLTITAGTGLSGGGSVGLGSSVTINNAGVLSLSSTQATVSASTGNITISLPQNIDTASSPTFAGLNLSNAANQIVLGNAGTLSWTPTTARTLTLPDITDTLVGKTTTDTLTNKTLTSPTINGTVTTALTVNGTTNTTPSDAVDINLLHTGGTATNGLLLNMNGSGGTTTNGLNISQSAGTLSNGVNLSGTIANAISFVGTNFTKLINSTNFNVTNSGVVTGSTYNGITIGATIQPSAAGTLALQSNGINAITIDTGSAGSTINLGNTNAAAIALGNATQNTTLTLTGTGLTTLGGNMTFSGSSARTITGPNTGAAGALALTTTGNLSGITINSANATSGNSGGVSLSTGNITTSGTSGNVALEVGTGGTLGTIQLGVASNAPVTTGTGLTTLGGNLTFSGSSARTITGPNTGATGSLALTTTGNISGLTITTAAGSSGNSGAIAIQSGNTTSSGTSGGITMDVGSGASANGTIAIGNTNASALTIGRASVTTSISGTADANNLKIGSGTTILKHLSATNTFDAAGIALGSCGDLGTVTVTGAAVGDSVTASPTAVSGGIETLLLNWNAYVSSANTVTIRACSVATLGTQNPANQTWRVDVWQH